VWLWLAALVVALLMMGPGLQTGALLNLDLLVLDALPVPHGIWGLGPELPRRVPLWGPMAWVAWLIGGEIVGKGLMVLSVVVAAAGMYRLVTQHVVRSRAAAAGAAALYAVGPFLLTRLAVGQLTVVWVMAMLPWAAPTLLHPSKSVRTTLCWSAVLGLGGVFGGIVAGALVLAGEIADRGRRPAAVMLAFLLGQLPWITALAVVTMTTHAEAIAGSTFFRPRIDGVADAARLMAGFGFWNRPFQVGGEHPAFGACFGAALFVLALAGVRELPQPWRRPFTVLGIGSLVFSASSAVWPTAVVVNRFTDTPFGAPMRETQRFLVPYLLWLAPSAAAGAVRLARAVGPSLGPTVRVAPLALAAALAGPGLWGLGGQLEPIRFPREWGEARSLVNAQPGTVLALPWYQYFTIDLADDRLLLDVVPYYFGGDVLGSSDPNLAVEKQQEVPDPREPIMDTIVADARQGAQISARLVPLGVRWVVLQHEVDWSFYSGLPSDPGLERVVTGNTMDLYRVRGWVGEVVADDGTPVRSSAVVSPLHSLDASGPATFATPYQSGWMRGWSTASRSPNGLVRLPGGSGVLWYWPSLLVLSADAATLAAVLTSAGARPLHRFRRPRKAP
jgi:hypothetical protein